MDQFAHLPAEERAIVFREAAAHLGLGAATVVEKDFWVCWTLKRIFSCAALPGPLFKGGTSLSKAYKVIERFSEDIDIVLDRHILGFIGEQDPLSISGANKRNRKLDELAGKCSETVQGTVRNELQSSLRSILGGSGWHINEDPADRSHQSLVFAYPASLDADLRGLGTYIRPVVRLEFGCRGDVWPSEHRSIQPYIADVFPDLFAQPDVAVHVLRPQRTFWEKATLLHAVFHSGKMPPLPDSRGTTTTWSVCIGTSSDSSP